MVRTDRDLQSIGKVADLVPTAAVMAVGDIGTVDGEEFVVGGRQQLDHGRGPWDEFFVEFTQSRRWAWVAKAQGKFYVTTALTPSAPLPAWEQMVPGNQGVLEGSNWTVAERGASALVSAEGELPFAAKPGDSGRYVDLEGPNAAFATIDYGDGREPPKFFVGRQVDPTKVVLVRTAVGPRPEQKVDLGKLKCPSCGGPMPIRTPETTERAACQFCHALVDVNQGNLALAETLRQPKIEPLIPLGTEGTLRGEQVVCIGFMQRGTRSDGELFTWREYLFHAPGGYRWLMEDNGHFMWIKPVSAASVSVQGLNARHEGRTHRLFSTAHSTVDFVIGEFYWRVRVGDTADLADFIDPPYIVSEERTDNEVNWSAGEYVEGKELWKALALPGSPPKPQGVGVAQPNPVRLGLVSGIALLLMVGFCLIAAVLDGATGGQVVYEGPLPMPPVAGETPEGAYASYSSTFPIGPRTPLEIQVSTTSDNQWVAVAGSLVNQNTADVIDFFVDAGYYHGYSEGESWTEGSQNGSINISAPPPGNYFVRFDPEWQAFPQPGAAPIFSAPTATVRVLSGKRGMGCFCCGFMLLLLPWGISFMRRGSFENRRNQNSNLH
ncbi:MAG: DUF4178 domain-containing protein [Sandaracinaceae bacterium]|nr:DUF4178 domain-containing protein [Sandaracinaceae bacterium]